MNSNPTWLIVLLVPCEAALLGEVAQPGVGDLPVDRLGPV